MRENGTLEIFFYIVGIKEKKEAERSRILLLTNKKAQLFPKPFNSVIAIIKVYLRSVLVDEARTLFGV